MVVFFFKYYYSNFIFIKNHENRLRNQNVHKNLFMLYIYILTWLLFTLLCIKIISLTNLWTLLSNDFDHLANKNNIFTFCNSKTFSGHFSQIHANLETYVITFLASQFTFLWSKRLPIQGHLELDNGIKTGLGSRPDEYWPCQWFSQEEHWPKKSIGYVYICLHWICKLNNKLASLGLDIEWLLNSGSRQASRAFWGEFIMGKGLFYFNTTSILWLKSSISRHFHFLVNIRIKLINYALIHTILSLPVYLFSKIIAQYRERLMIDSYMALLKIKREVFDSVYRFECTSRNFLEKQNKKFC